MDVLALAMGSKNLIDERAIIIRIDSADRYPAGRSRWQGTRPYPYVMESNSRVNLSKTWSTDEQLELETSQDRSCPASSV